MLPVQGPVRELSPTCAATKVSTPQPEDATAKIKIHVLQLDPAQPNKYMKVRKRLIKRKIIIILKRPSLPSFMAFISI